jgi:hypothetical protein
MRNWWRKKSGYAKTITALAVLQIGLCFASPGEPRWFDWLFRITPPPDGLRLGLIFVEFCFCLFTFLLLLIALLMSVAASWSSVDSEVSVAPKSEHAIRDDGSDETK